MFNNAIRVLRAYGSEDLAAIMRELKVDPYGIRIMLPKGAHYLIRINSLSGIAANILKQELLSVGGECALPKEALVARNKKTDCLLIATLAQYNTLTEKLKKQPFSLAKLSGDIAAVLANYSRDGFTLKLGKYRLDTGRSTRVMGIVNTTPDSFSGDGLYRDPIARWENRRIDYLVEYAVKQVKDGADILDIGGESTRPQAAPVPVKEELSRTIPLIKALAKRIRIPISIDTYKPEVARAALDNGAVMVNDISGLRDPKMAKVVARYKASCVIMHMKGTPRTMQKAPAYRSLIGEITFFLNTAIEKAEQAGVDPDKIIIDPGIGFGKSLEHNLEILKRLSEFKSLGKPILIGTSRKAFIGKLLDLPVEKRLTGTIASCVLAMANGADIVRVHDVKEVAQALKLTQAVLN
jgi:dihydropteroate synthase